MTKPPDDRNPLQPLLRDAEAQLRERLHEACEAEASGIEHKSASEIRQLEDALLAAAMAAEQTIALRRHISRQEEEQEEGARRASAAAPGSGEQSPEAPSDTAVPAVREFRDREGRAWRAWPVTPGVARRSSKTHYLGDFQQGWICFEALDNSARRRLPCARARWDETGDEGLEDLLSQAIMVPERRRKDSTN